MGAIPLDTHTVERIKRENKVYNQTRITYRAAVVGGIIASLNDTLNLEGAAESIIATADRFVARMMKDEPQPSSLEQYYEDARKAWEDE